jgi:type I restriction enzyme S subunit
MVEADVAGANITQDTARLAITGASPIYVLECLRSSELQMWMETFTKGAAVRGINLTDVKRIRLPLPPASDQSKFARIATAVQCNRQALLVSAEQMAHLFASLQDRAFRGGM